MFATTRAVVGASCELERRLDVLARRLEVALATTAARAPAEDVGAEEVAGQVGAARQGERLVEERDRRGDARELVAAHAEAEEQVGPVDVGELRPFGELAGDEQQLDGLAGVTVLGARPGLARERAHLELRRAGRADIARGPTRRAPTPRCSGVPR